MVALSGAPPRADIVQVPIETMRGMAVVLLVAYHVIGRGPAVGLDIGYPHVLRLYADFFVDLRMPFFAFIAGYVYALRPLTIGGYTDFLGGKIRRLVIPGAVAIAAFLVVSNIMGTDFARPWATAWTVFVYPYAHYWFLQSILLIFVAYGLVDALLGGRCAPVLLAIAIATYLMGFRFPMWPFSLNDALYLLPFFLLGVCFVRYAARIWEEAEHLTLLLLVVALVCAFANIRELIDTGTFSLVKRDLQSLLFGLAACALALLWCPRLPLLEKLSPYAFTIYLYHIFGTAGARLVADKLGIASLDVRFVWGLACGLALPILMHEVLLRIPRAQRVVLGR